jgi:hypothetical protein
LAPPRQAASNVQPVKKRKASIRSGEGLEKKQRKLTSYFANESKEAPAQPKATIPATLEPANSVVPAKSATISKRRVAMTVEDDEDPRTVIPGGVLTEYGDDAPLLVDAEGWAAKYGGATNAGNILQESEEHVKLCLHAEEEDADSRSGASLPITSDGNWTSEGGESSWAANMADMDLDNHMSVCDTLDVDVAKMPQPRRRKYSYEPGTSKSALASRIKIVKAKAGKLSDRKLVERFRAKIKKMDGRAEFGEDTTTGKQVVIHSGCGEEVTMQERNHTSYFSQHLERCKSKSRLSKITDYPLHRSASMRNELEEEKDVASPGPDDDLDSVDDEVPAPTRPCYGLTNEDTNLAQYIIRSGAEGGGARSVSTITCERFATGRRTPLDVKLYGNVIMKHDLKYSDLPAAAKEEIKALQSKEMRWRIVRGHGLFPSAVFSEQCEHILTDVSMEHPVCSPCKSLLNDRRFKQCIKIKLPKPDNRKFNNHQYKRQDDMSVFSQNAGLAKCFDGDFTRSYAFKFVHGVANGKFDDHRLLFGFMKAAVTLESKKRRGVGKQNMRYDPLLDNMANLLDKISPKAYEALRTAGISLPSRNTLK